MNDIGSAYVLILFAFLHSRVKRQIDVKEFDGNK